LESEGLARAQQQRSTIQVLMPQSAPPVVDLDEKQAEPSSPAAVAKAAAKESPLVALRARLAALQQRYGDRHPEIRKVNAQIADEEAKEAAVKAASAAASAEVAAATPSEPKPETQPARRPPVPPSYTNPVLQAQLRMAEDEIAKHQAEQRRLNKQITAYQAKLEAIPVHEQEITALVRDYEISRAHYSQLLEKGLSAETATQLEIRQKGEKFSILD